MNEMKIAYIESWIVGLLRREAEQVLQYTKENPDAEDEVIAAFGHRIAEVKQCVHHMVAEVDSWVEQRKAGKVFFAPQQWTDSQCKYRVEIAR